MRFSPYYSSYSWVIHMLYETKTLQAQGFASISPSAPTSHCGFTLHACRDLFSSFFTVFFAYAVYFIYWCEVFLFDYHNTIIGQLIVNLQRLKVLLLVILSITGKFYLILHCCGKLNPDSNIPARHGKFATS